MNKRKITVTCGLCHETMAKIENELIYYCDRGHKVILDFEES